VGITGQEGFGSGGEVWDAFYTLFCLLTTVNHPDGLMWLADAKPAAFIFIVTFIFFTNIIGLNLLLAIVYGEYVSILASEREEKALLRSKMLDTAFISLTEMRGREYLTPDELLEILRKVEQVEAPDAPCDDDKLEMVVRMMDNKALSAQDNDGLDDSAQDHKIDIDDMKVALSLSLTPICITLTLNLISRSSSSSALFLCE